MTSARPPAKINLALAVGPPRADGKHEVVTVLQRIDLRDELALDAALHVDVLVEGFAEDTLVRAALTGLAGTSGEEHGWHARLEKHIPIAAGLGGGSSDAAAALRLANRLLAKPLDAVRLHDLASALGSDVPFFLTDGAQLATGTGSDLTRLVLPLDYLVLLVLPAGAEKSSTEAVYRAFDERSGADGFDERSAALLDALERVGHARDLAELPRNDLASSPLAEMLESLGAFRADVSGAGPTVYGLFEDAEEAERARSVLRGAGRTWLTRPVDF